MKHKKAVSGGIWQRPGARHTLKAGMKNTNAAVGMFMNTELQCCQSRPEQHHTHFPINYTIPAPPEDSYLRLYRALCPVIVKTGHRKTACKGGMT